MQTYRVAIIGLGRMGSTIDDELQDNPDVVLPYSIAAATVASERLQLAAGADVLPERRQAFGKRWGISALYDDVDTMIERERPDIVAVCTTATGLQKPGRRAPSHEFRDDSHAEISVALAAAGVPMLFCEKAMACSMQAADAVLEACVTHGTRFNTGVLRRFDNRYAAVRDLIGRGDIGEPIAAVHYGPATLLHGHIHSIDTLSFLLGDPRVLAVRGELLPRDFEVVNDHLAEDPPATYQLQFEGGVGAWSIPAGPFEFELIGDRGVVRILNNGAATTLRKATADAPPRAKLKPVEPMSVTPASPVVAILEDLAAAHDTGGPTLGNVELTHHITEACFAVVESHRRGGAWVDLPLEQRDTYVFHV